MCNFLIANGHLHRHGGDTVRAVYYIIIGCLVTQVSQGCTDVNLDALCHTLTDAHVVLSAHVFLNIGGEIVASHLDGVVGNDTAEGNNGDFRCATAYVNNHVALRCRHVDTYTNGSGHRLKEEVYIAAPSMLCGVAHGTQFHFCATAGHAHDHAERGREEAAALMNHLDEATKHLFGSVEVSDDTIAEGTNHANFVVCLFVHLLGHVADSNHFFRVAVEGHDGGLIDNNLTIADDDGIGGT